MDGPEDMRKRTDSLTVTRWLQNQRGSPQYRPAPHASKAIARVMRPLSHKHGAGSTGLAPHWEQIVGPRFARISRPVKITGRQGGRTLVISAPGPAGALLSAASDKILERANSFLGAGHVTRLKVIQTRIKTEEKVARVSQGLDPQTQDKLRSELENVTDPDVKQALEQLGRKVLSKSED